MPEYMGEGVSNVVAAAPYSNRPPSPPYIPIPMNFPKGAEGQLLPSFQNVDAMNLSNGDLSIITGNKSQTATDRSVGWSYESRRRAQSILDYLFLGPLSVARDEAWLAEEGITMIIVSRHSRVAQARLMSLDKVAQSLGIVVEYLDVADNNQLIRGFPEIVRKINGHLLEIYHRQSLGVQEGRMAIDSSSFKGGKVLLVCETGNDRSAFIAAAYVMTVYGKDMVSSVQFVSVQRFSANFDEDAKRMLQAYEDILTAQHDVSSATRHVPRTRKHGESRNLSKRGIEETFEEDDLQELGSFETFTIDRDRYRDRAKFVPFVDHGQT